MRAFLRNRGAAAGLLIMGLVALLSAFAPLLFPGSPWDMQGAPFARPGEEGFLLGSDSLGRDVAAVYFENPGYLGTIETDAAEIARLTRAAGAETIVGVDPISLGVMMAPSDYGADIVVGPTQPLGVHMHCGGGVGGYIASRDEERYVREYNGFLVSIAETQTAGQFGFGLAALGRFVVRLAGLARPRIAPTDNRVVLRVVPRD